MAHKRIDKTFSTCDLIRIWDENLTTDERNDITTFHSLIVPALDPTYDMVLLLQGLVVESKWNLPFVIADILQRRRYARQLGRESVVLSMFDDSMTGRCVWEWAKRYRLRQRVA